MTGFTTLIGCAELQHHLTDADWAVVDCRFSLDDPSRGRIAYTKSHIPGAVYAHLDEDLSGPIIPGRTGRHPVPEVETFARCLSAWGIDARVQVVAYDDSGGAIAARLWWMLRWLGHRNVAVLDGGWPAWERDGRASRGGTEARASRDFAPRIQSQLVADAAEVQRIRVDPSYRLCDSRSAERYRGENETIDPVAGHIPGAVSIPYADNLTPEEHFLPPAELRVRFHSQLGNLPSERIVLYCGSGVTAALNALAMVHAGLGNARLYPGSWSEWITDPQRPVETGGTP